MIEKTRLYYYEEDIKKVNGNDNCLDVYDKKVSKLKTNKELYEFHYDVLPQPFFGDYENADILFLAKNPSYAEYEDEYDTYSFLEYFKNIYNRDFVWNNDYEDYETLLKKVDFFEGFEQATNNIFFNTWKWWNLNVIGHNVKVKQNKKVGIINLCPYHSKNYLSYADTKDYEKNWLESQKSNQETIKKAVESAQLIIVVWGKPEWQKYLNGFNKDVIVLNQTSKMDENGKVKYGQNINNLEVILKAFDPDYKQSDKNAKLKEVYKEDFIEKIKLLDYFELIEEVKG